MKLKVLVLVVVALVAMIAVFLQDPISQPTNYHHFADDRSMIGIPRALNVLSNIPFLIIGIWGMWWLRDQSKTPERHAYLILFAGVALTCFGSGYYHADPSNDRLVWDRFPMTLGFMGLFTAIVTERVTSKAEGLLLPLLLIGLGSVLYWDWTESRGVGDLRPYVLVQFLPLLLIPLTLLLFPPKYTRGSDIGVAIGWYLAAKVLEAADVPIYAATGFVSGHSLKHLAAAVAALVLLKMLQRRVPIAEKALAARL